MHLPDDIYSINGDNTIGVVPYGDNTYLIAIDGYGIDYFDSKREKFLHYSFGDESQLNSNNITALLIDSRKEIWAGTFLNGINYSNHSTNLFSLVHNNRYSSEFIRQGIITDFLKDKNENFWIATDGGGLYLKEKNKDSFFNFVPGVKENTIPGRAVIKMEEDDDGIWLTTYAGGLAKYNSRSRSFKVYKHNPEDPNSVVSNKLNVITTYNGKLWISSYGTGISVLDKHTGKFKNYRSILNDSTSLPSEWVQVFFRDSDNVLWLGTSNGLSRYIPEKDCFKTYYFDKGTSVAEKNSIIDIVIDSKGNFWLGTGGAGIILFDRHKESFEFYTTSDGLSSNNVKSIIEDNYSNLWIATNNGITRFEINSRTGKPYTIEDGVPAAAFFSNSKYKADDGNIYFGTNNGYLVIDPLHAKKNEHVPPVYLTDLKIFNESVLPSDSNSILKESINHTKSVSLTYDKNALTLEFSALNYNNPLKNQYEYILEGFEENWIHAGNRRTVTYTNLDPGTYHFKCKGSNNDLVWNASPASLEIVILPPWWKTWWCISIEIAMLLLLLYSIYRWRINNIRKHNQLLEETISQRTKELEESNEQLEAFVYKASHDIKGPLRSIIGLTTVGQKDVSDETALVYFQHILSSTKKLDKLLVDLLQVAKVKQASVNNEKIIFDELVTDAISKFKHLPGFDNIQVNTLIDEKAPFYSDKHLMYSIIQNLVENPIKYQDPMKAKPFLNIEIETTKRQALLKFTDNGLGIPKDYHSKVFEMFFKVDEVSQGTGLGLYIVKTTVEKLGGKISMTSKHGEGTTFTINISNSPEKNL